MKSSDLIKKPLIFHPFLYGIFPCIFLFTNNLGHLEFSQALMPLVLIISFTFLYYLILNNIIKDNIKSGIIVSFSLILFFSYGHVYDLIKVWQLIYFKTHNLHIHRYLLSVWIVVFSAVIYICSKSKNNLYNFNNALNASSLALFVIPFLNITNYNFHNYENNNSYGNEVEIIDSIDLDKNLLPDIYFIVPDAFASSKVLNTVFNYDNSNFIEEMKNKGFYNAYNSNSNYAHTASSLNASLNMKYLKNEMSISNIEIQNNEVLKYVKSLGYKYIHFNSGWGLTDRNLFADLSIRCGYLNEFIMILIPTTIFRIIDEKFNFIKLGQRNKILCNLKELENMSKMKGPKFTFLHLESPHPPYVFNENGDAVVNEPLTMIGFQPKDAYLNQLKYIEKRLSQFVDKIIATSSVRPIIIIQADHGPATTFKNKETPFESMPTNENLFERMGIVNLFLLKDECKDSLYDSISPVNTFRFIFNCYFNTNYDLLDDLSFYNKGSEQFLNITKILSKKNNLE